MLVTFSEISLKLIPNHAEVTHGFFLSHPGRILQALHYFQCSYTGIISDFPYWCNNTTPPWINTLPSYLNSVTSRNYMACNNCTCKIEVLNKQNYPCD